MKPSPKQQEYMDLEARYGAHNYKPLPVVLNKGKGTKVFDVDGNEYYDFLSAYSAAVSYTHLDVYKRQDADHRGE